MQSKAQVVFKFRRPAGAQKKQPSRAMTQALQQLSQAEEMREFIKEANGRNRVVVLEVFHSAADGHPILIHFGAIPPEAA